MLFALVLEAGQVIDPGAPDDPDDGFGHGVPPSGTGLQQSGDGPRPGSVDDFAGEGKGGAAKFSGPPVTKPGRPTYR